LRRPLGKVDIGSDSAPAFTPVFEAMPRFGEALRIDLDADGRVLLSADADKKHPGAPRVSCAKVHFGSMIRYVPPWHHMVVNTHGTETKPEVRPRRTKIGVSR